MKVWRQPKPRWESPRSYDIDNTVDLNVWVDRIPSFRIRVNEVVIDRDDNVRVSVWVSHAKYEGMSLQWTKSE